MRNLLTNLKRLLVSWLRQPKDEMDKRQAQSNVQVLFPPREPDSK